MTGVYLLCGRVIIVIALSSSPPFYSLYFLIFSLLNFPRNSSSDQHEIATKFIGEIENYKNHHQKLLYTLLALAFISHIHTCMYISWNIVIDHVADIFSTTIIFYPYGHNLSISNYVHMDY